MPLSADTESAVELLQRVQVALRCSEDSKLSAQCSNELNTLISVLEAPVLRSLLSIHDSLRDLKHHVSKHPSLMPNDFDISHQGQLILHSGLENSIENKRNSAPEQSCSSPTSKAGKSTKMIGYSESNDVSVTGSFEKSDPSTDGVSKVSYVSKWDAKDEGNGEDLKSHSISSNGIEPEVKKVLSAAAQGREIHHIQLFKPESSSLGFSVVGLRSEQRGDLGIYVQGIQQNGLAAKDGRLQEGDQILAIDGQVLDSYISHQQAISILQKATKVVDLIVARAPQADKQEHKLLADIKQEVKPSPVQQQEKSHEPLADSVLIPPTQESHTSNMLNTEWAQVEVIHLVNDGSGLGFGIIGGRSTGVVVKTILPGGVADREGRLQSGDHILQIGDVNLRGMGSDQVATVLRQAGSHVRLVVARPVEPSSPDFYQQCQLGRSAPVVETRVLNDPEELARQLGLLHNGFPSAGDAFVPVPVLGDHGPGSSTSSSSTLPAGMIGQGTDRSERKNSSPKEEVDFPVTVPMGQSSPDGSQGSEHLGFTGVVDDVLFHQQELSADSKELTGDIVEEGGEGMTLSDLPEMEMIELEITKDQQGLGITIAGYVCEKEELSGIFVKSINAGSAADRNGAIQVNDQITEVDGRSLAGLSNHAAVDVLRATGQRVHLKLARYLRGPKFEQLQQAIANSELKTTPTTPNPPRAVLGEVVSEDALRSALGELERQDTEEDLAEAFNTSACDSVGLSYNPTSETVRHTSVIPIGDVSEMNPLTHQNYTSVPSQPSLCTSSIGSDMRLEDIELMIDTDYTGDLKPSVELAIKKKWSRIVGQDFEIVVAQLSKFEEGGGLGISLEGTVDVEDGKEVRPHHYLRSILAEGPVGIDGRLSSGDELLEVNSQKLLGLNHVEVVSILKELPRYVRLVCGRRRQGSVMPLHPIDAPTANRDTFAARNILGGSLQNLLPSSERLVKAKSDGSLASSANTAVTNDSSFSRMKSRSLEPIPLPMWSTEPQEITLIKGDRGLGFSILDYQDPLNPQDTVIVIRSLVPGGVAEKDGRLIPGDRLIAVNGINLENASLDQAVAALKGAPKGPVVISVAKPISVLESPGQLNTFLGELGSSEDGSLTDEALIIKSDEEDVERYEAMQESGRDLCTEMKTKRGASDVTASSFLPVDQPFASEEKDTRASILLVPVATERLLGGSSSTSVSSGREHVERSRADLDPSDAQLKVSRGCDDLASVSPGLAGGLSVCLYLLLLTL